MSDNEIKWMDLDEFLNEGYLQEVNRKFFHPLGLALAVNCDEDGVVTGIAGLWDYRDDPEGIVFGDGGVDADKATTVEAERLKHWNVRANMFNGYGQSSEPIKDVQPIGWTHPDNGS